MHHDGVHADQFHEHNVARETAFQRLVDHGVTAVLDDKCAAMKPLNIRKRFDQHSGAVRRSVDVYGHKGLASSMFEARHEPV